MLNAGTWSSSDWFTSWRVRYMSHPWLPNILTHADEITMTLYVAISECARNLRSIVFFEGRRRQYVFKPPYIFVILPAFPGRLVVGSTNTNDQACTRFVLILGAFGEPTWSKIPLHDRVKDDPLVTADFPGGADSYLMRCWWLVILLDINTNHDQSTSFNHCQPLSFTQSKNSVLWRQQMYGTLTMESTRAALMFQHFPRRDSELKAMTSRRTALDSSTQVLVRWLLVHEPIES